VQGCHVGLSPACGDFACSPCCLSVHFPPSLLVWPALWCHFPLSTYRDTLFLYLRSGPSWRWGGDHQEMDVHVVPWATGLRPVTHCRASCFLAPLSLTQSPAPCSISQGHFQVSNQHPGRPGLKFHIQGTQPRLGPYLSLSVPVGVLMRSVP
jgi:hypothetical protein